MAERRAGCHGRTFCAAGPDFTLLDAIADTLRVEGRPAEQLIGRSHCEAYPESKASPIGDLLRRVMRENVPEPLEHHYTLRDGCDMWLDARAYPTPDGGLAVFWRDVTDRKRTDDALRQSRERQIFLLTLPAALRSETDAQAVADRALRMLCDALNLDHCYIASCLLAEDCVDTLCQVGKTVCPPFPRNRAPRTFPKRSGWSTTGPW